jgi:hypothetical protein
MEKLASCCGFRKIKAGMAWSEYRAQVRKLSRFRTISETEKVELTRLKEIAANERQAFHDHCADESLEHK